MSEKPDRTQPGHALPAAREGQGQTAPLPRAPKTSMPSADPDTVASVGQTASLLPTGTQIGRYMILQLRGEGGMGVVYSAYDPNLDRRVALKLLKHGGSLPADAGARLKREAQLLAKVSHPNVVAVHDCGTFGDVVFVEMEFVDGKTLREWGTDKPWRTVLEAYLDAGRALEAVHREGIIHRDFKPSNVLVDAAGRVRVLDFGIARAAEQDDFAAPEAMASDPAPGSTRPMTDVPRQLRENAVVDIAPSRHGSATGTPPYMPPEQWRGAALDARADQYAFAASLFLSLYGVFPFTRPDETSMRSATARGPIAERPKGTDVPKYVDRALVRALSFDAADRFPSMHELLAALERDPAEKTRRQVAFAVGGLTLVSAIVFGVRYELGRDARACAVPADRMHEAWSEPQRTRVHDGIVRDGKPGAEETWAKTRTLLDAYTDRWAALRTDACMESRRASSKIADEALGARLVCLDWRLQDVRSLTEVLATDTDIAHEAVKAVSGLDPIEDCTKPQLNVALRLPRDADKRARFEAIRITIAEANTRNLAAKYTASRPLAQQAVDEARRHGLRMAEGRALLELADALGGIGEHKAMAKTLEDALVAAEASHDDLAAFHALVSLALVAGLTLGDPATGTRWEAHAGAILERVGAPDVQAAMLERVRAILARERADFPAALAHGKRSLELSTRAHGAGHLDVARAESALGGAYYALARFDEAIEHHERARKSFEDILGPRHPDCAGPLIDMAEVHRRRGDVAGAVTMIHRSLAILVPALGAEHPQVGKMHNNLAVSLGEMAAYDEARKHFERALEIRRKAYGEEHPGVALALSNLSQAELEQTKDAPAAITKQRSERSVAIYEKVSGPNEPYLRWPLINLSEIAIREHALDDALRYAERAASVVAKSEGADHPDLAEPMNQIARVHLAANEPGKAIEALERVMALLAKAKREESGTMSKAKFLLARALRLRPGPPEAGVPARARQLALDAAAHFEKVGHRPNEQEIKTWLAVNEGWLTTPSR